MKERHLAEIDPASRGWRARTLPPDSGAGLVREVSWATALLVDPKSRAGTGLVSTVTFKCLKTFVIMFYKIVSFNVFILSGIYGVESFMILVQMK